MYYKFGFRTQLVREKRNPNWPFLGGQCSEVKGQIKKILWIMLRILIAYNSLNQHFLITSSTKAASPDTEDPLFKFPKNGKIYYINWKKKKIWRDFEGQWGPTRGPNQKTLLHMARGPDIWLRHIRSPCPHRVWARSYAWKSRKKNKSAFLAQKVTS